MNDSYPITYISILLGLLFIVAIFLFREIIKSRRIESRYNKLQEKLKKQKGTAQEYYELAGIFLDNYLYHFLRHEEKNLTTIFFQNQS